MTAQEGAAATVEADPPQPDAEAAPAPPAELQYDTVKRLRLHTGTANIPHPEKVTAGGRPNIIQPSPWQQRSICRGSASEGVARHVPVAEVRSAVARWGWLDSE